MSLKNFFEQALLFEKLDQDKCHNKKDIFVDKEDENDEDEEIMSSNSMFTPASETGFSADTYAPGYNRLPNSLFKKPLKRKKLKESYYANPEEAFSKGYISAYQLAKIKAEKEGRELTPEEEMFYADPENWDNKRPAAEEEIKDFFTKIKLDLDVK